MKSSVVYIFFATMLLSLSACSSKEKLVEETTQVEATAPPATWKEHWFEHEQNLNRVYYDDDLALYYDKDVDTNIQWPAPYMSKIWKYVKSVYGDFGEEGRLYTILHTNKYSGGHPSVYMDASHDYRNVVDCGPYTWEKPLPQEGLSVMVHEIGHIVEGSANGIKQNPAWEIWKDSKWAEIFIYDIYKGIGEDEFALQTYNDLMNQYDDYPRENTQWFKNWFYPIYSEYGEAKVLNKFYDLLAVHFPKTNDGKAFSRRMNMGEFIHFWSGAAGTNLKPLAGYAFGWTDEWEAQLNVAVKNFPGVQYE